MNFKKIVSICLILNLLLIVTSVFSYAETEYVEVDGIIYGVDEETPSHIAIPDVVEVGSIEQCYIIGKIDGAITLSANDELDLIEQHHNNIFVKCDVTMGDNNALTLSNTNNEIVVESADLSVNFANGQVAPKLGVWNGELVYNLESALAYNLTYDTGGGSEVPQEVHLEGEQLVAPTAPTKTGYTFAGWYTDNTYSTPFSFSTMPNANITAYAKWNINAYTITYNSNGGTSVAPSVFAFNENTVAPSEPSKTNYAFGGWYTDTNCTMPFTFGSTIMQNLTLYAKWQMSDCILTFNANGGTACDSITMPYTETGCSITMPTTTRSNYFFKGWKDSKGNTYQAGVAYTMPFNANSTLTAQWEIDVTNCFTYQWGTDPISGATGYVITGLASNPFASSNTITLPRTYNGSPVVAIGAKAMYATSSGYGNTFLANNSYWKSSSCSAVHITVPNNIKSVGGYAFSQLGGKGSSIVFEDNGCQVINADAFNRCRGITSIILPNSLKYIGRSAFEYCDTLSSFSIPNGVLDIGSYAFKNCYKITSITIPPSVQYMAMSAFDWCKALTTVNWNSPYVQYIEDGYSNDYLYFGSEYSNSWLYYYYRVTHKTYNDASRGLKSDNYAWFGRYGIPAYTFVDCKALKTINFNPTCYSTYSYIGNSAFKNCSALTSFSFANFPKLDYIGTNTFASTKLSGTIVFPSSMKMVGIYAFKGVTTMTGASLPSSTTVESNSFPTTCTVTRY